jgi:hypothetical protein
MDSLLVLPPRIPLQDWSQNGTQRRRARAGLQGQSAQGGKNLSPPRLPTYRPALPGPYAGSRPSGEGRRMTIDNLAARARRLDRLAPLGQPGVRTAAAVRLLRDGRQPSAASGVAGPAGWSRVPWGRRCWRDWNVRSSRTVGSGHGCRGGAGAGSVHCVHCVPRVEEVQQGRRCCFVPLSSRDRMDTMDALWPRGQRVRSSTYPPIPLSKPPGAG